MPAGREFQVDGAATEKARRARCDVSLKEGEYWKKLYYSIM